MTLKKKEYSTEQINTTELADPSVYPDDDVLKKILGKSHKAYCDLLCIYEKHGLSHEWRYYNDGKSWLCKVQKKKKTIVWMSAWKGFMKATVYIPEKYIQGLYNLDISEAERDVIRKASNAGKSKPCMYDVRSAKILPTIEEVIKYKISCK